MNLIFPVAGDANRFGKTFKPFLMIGDVTFIETVFRPFLKWVDSIDSVYFICTQEQDEMYGVCDKMPSLIDHPNVEVVVLPNKTSGPYQTVRAGINQRGITGSTIICDCDHALDVDDIFTEMRSDECDVVVPSWNISSDEWMNWSKIVLDQKNNIQMICEKQRIESSDYTVLGIIGCIGFKNVDRVFVDSGGVYVSDALRDLYLKNKTINITKPAFAHFFGTPEMLENHVNFLRKRCTILCDIDGVLLKHDPHSTCDLESNTRLEAAQLLNQWKLSGNKIIITTARNEKYRSDVIRLLNDFDIHYDELVMSLPPGPRILINDHKPSKVFASQANAIELERDEGLGKIDLSQFTDSSDLKIETTFDGGSFAKTYLVSSPSGDTFVRKHIIKNKENSIHYDKLKRQMNDLIRFDFMSSGLTPKVIGEVDSDFNFYFDMEYLKDYHNLSDLNTEARQKALGALFSQMSKFVYAFKREVDGIAWVNQHLDNKIFPKFDAYSKLDKAFDTLISSDKVIINSKEYSGLRKLVEHIDKHKIKPNSIRPVHGDFTFENILWNGKDVKLIDMDGSDYFDAAELDLGKMCQSVFSNYNSWKNLESPIYKCEGNEFECVEHFLELNLDAELDNIIFSWENILNDDRRTIVDKGIFYMCMYFIRFVPFRMKVSREHGLFALIMAIVWLSKIGEKND